MELDQREKSEPTHGKGVKENVSRGVTREKPLPKKVIEGIGKTGEEAEKEAKGVKFYWAGLANQGHASHS